MKWFARFDSFDIRKGGVWNPSGYFLQHIFQSLQFLETFFHSTLDEILFLSIFFPGSGGVVRPWMHLSFLCLNHSSFIIFIHFGCSHTKDSLSHQSKGFVQPLHLFSLAAFNEKKQQQREETVAGKHESYKKKIRLTVLQQNETIHSLKCLWKHSHRKSRISVC